MMTELKQEDRVKILEAINGEANNITQGFDERVLAKLPKELHLEAINMIIDFLTQTILEEAKKDYMQSLNNIKKKNNI